MADGIELPNIDVSHEWILEAHNRTMGWILEVHQATLDQFSTVVVVSESSEDDDND